MIPSRVLLNAANNFKAKPPKPDNTIPYAIAGLAAVGIGYYYYTKEEPKKTSTPAV